MARFKGRSIRPLPGASALAVDRTSGRARAATIRGKECGAMGPDLDARHDRLACVGIDTPEAAVVDPKSGAVKLIARPWARTALGLALDAGDNPPFAVAQDAGNRRVVIAETGETLPGVTGGATPLNLACRPQSRLAHVANRRAGAITVIDPKGQIGVSLETGGLSNQPRADDRGNVRAMTRPRGANGRTGDRLWCLRPKPTELLRARHSRPAALPCLAPRTP